LGDPRTAIVNERMREIAKIIAVSSGKGGVGKSLLASTLALELVRKGYEVGLFDLDFTSPSTHVILGIEDNQPKENRGLEPADVHGMKYMSIIYYTGEHATPLRGTDFSNALIELLSITKWGKLDFLIIDMPPGIGDATLDLLRLIRNIRFLIVTTPSQVAFETVRKLASLLKQLKIQVIGTVENLKMHPSKTVKQRTLKLGLNFLGEIQYDPEVEEVVGDANKLLQTTFAQKVKQFIPRIEAETQAQRS
jgi:ATP-binding protein involved in chromosome partitioning